MSSKRWTPNHRVIVPVPGALSCDALACNGFFLQFGNMPYSQKALQVASTHGAMLNPSNCISRVVLALLSCVANVTPHASWSAPSCIVVAKPIHSKNKLEVLY